MVRFGVLVLLGWTFLGIVVILIWNVLKAGVRARTDRTVSRPMCSTAPHVTVDRHPQNLVSAERTRQSHIA